jgi:hypothetical protein
MYSNSLQTEQFFNQTTLQIFNCEYEACFYSIYLKPCVQFMTLGSTLNAILTVLYKSF